MINSNKLQFIIIVIIAFFSVTCCQAASSNSQEVITESIDVLREMSRAEDSGAFSSLMKDAKGIAIFPSILRVGWGIGGQYGKGIIFRKKSGLGVWNGPAFVKIKSLSLGPQIGIQSVALVLLIYNERGMEGFTENNFTLGGNASIAIGPIGRTLSADTDYKFKASIYSYSISKGAYVGASFQGSTIEEDRKANELFYGKEISNKYILKNKISINPNVIRLLLLVNQLSK